MTDEAAPSHPPELVERVAKAIRNAWNGEHQKPTVPFESLADDVREDWRYLARVALTEAAIPPAPTPLDPRTRLGMWLSAVQCRTHRQFQPEGRHTTWMVRLVEDAGEEDESEVAEGEGATLTEALEAALQKVGAE